MVAVSFPPESGAVKSLAFTLFDQNDLGFVKSMASRKFGSVVFSTSLSVSSI